MDSPRRGSHKTAPGNARGGRCEAFDRALKGRNIASPVRPSGLFRSFSRYFAPRALPWAVLSGPFGAKNHESRNIKTCASG